MASLKLLPSAAVWCTSSNVTSVPMIAKARPTNQYQYVGSQNTAYKCPSLTAVADRLIILHGFSPLASSTTCDSELYRLVATSPLMAPIQ